SNLTATATSSSTIDLSWTASTDNVNVAEYDIYRGSTYVGSSTSTVFSDSGLTPSTAYSYTVKANDSAGNVSAASNTATATTLASVGNLAAGKTYNASTTWSTAYTPDKAFDGDATSRWAASSGSSTNQWLSVDFGTATTFNQVVLNETTFQ